MKQKTGLWAKMRESYAEFSDLEPKDLGWWWVLIVFLTSLLAGLIVNCTPRWFHIPLGAAIFLFVLSSAREKFRKQRRLPPDD